MKDVKILSYVPIYYFPIHLNAILCGSRAGISAVVAALQAFPALYCSMLVDSIASLRRRD
jgi:hypothetical protein